jgi:hypothetical protein
MARTLVLIVALLVSGCSQTTRVLVEIEAERGVRDDPRYARTHVAVSASAACGTQRAGEVLALDVNLAGQSHSWPVRIELLPCESDATRRYEVVASADAEVAGSTPREYSPFVIARARSGYVAGQTRVLRLTLQAACRDVFSCGDGETCRDGRCVLADIAPMSLPVLGQPTDARSAPGDDASALDAAMDAPGLDAFAMDAPEPIDVGPEVDAGLAVDAQEAPDAFEPLDAFVVPDAFDPPDAFEPPDARLRTCSELFGAFPGYQLCAENPTSCEFWTSGSCYAGCSAITGLSPEECWDDDSGGRCSRGSLTACVNTSIICICTRIP